jgi:uncharacterized membrane protein YfcA
LIYAAGGALLIGISLGLLGSGGSILTVPVLVYLLGRDEKLAIAESLAIVGGIALVGVVQYAWRRQTRWKYVICFGAPGMGGAYLGAIAAKHVAGSLQLAVFALVMLAAAWAMLRGGLGKRTPPDETPAQTPRLTGKRLAEVATMGLAVGMMTGFVGVGGGFLIVPALVLLARLPMREAIGTSLAIIFLNSITGFLKHQRLLPELGLHPDWAMIATFIGVGGVGSVVGGLVSSKVNQKLLRKIFAVFVILMGLFILARETPAALGLQQDTEPVDSKNGPS